MFSNLFFFFLILILVNINLEATYPFWIESPLNAFLSGLFLYFAFLTYLYIRTRFLRRIKSASDTSTSWIINSHFLLFFCLYQFGLGAQRLWNETRILSHFQIFPAIFALSLYFIGLFFYYYWIYQRQGCSFNLALKQARKHVQLLLPFALPFLFFSLLFDIFHLFLSPDVASSPFFVYGFNTLLILLTIIFMPFLVVRLWECKPLKDSVLLPKLEAICSLLHFKHGGIKIWTVMNHVLTAGIIGIVPRFRYIMFTQKILHDFSPEELEAILVHEIGHSRHKHLLIYPFILAGMLVVSSLLSFLYGEEIGNFFDRLDTAYPSDLWSFGYILTLFTSYALIFGIYLRLVFGFYSRLFERQADLNIYQYHPQPTQMIRALDHIAIATGHTHTQPSWHHFSIQDRINFLKRTQDNPALVLQHHLKVKVWIVIYFLLLALGLLLIFYQLDFLPFGIVAS